MKKTAIKPRKEQSAFHILTEGHITSAKGFKAGGLHCGIKYKRPDIGWVYSEVPAKACAVYTTNRIQAAPLAVTQDSLAYANSLQAVVVNSGNANACTGELGLNHAFEMRRLTAEQFQIPEYMVAVASTGVIGEVLPMDKVKRGIKQFHLNEADVGMFERSILTTDTGIKHVAVRVVIDEKTVTIGGAAKGSGMIHPNMATMLAFITTDANLDQHAFPSLLRQVTDQTFNMITVDGDTSTNDMVLALANGLAGNQPLNKDHPQWGIFLDAFTYICKTLAKMIARDGEGATKLIEVEVKGASNQEAARRISKAIVGSNLVKTAVYGCDPNWGRILCAAGYSGESLHLDAINVEIGGIPIVNHGLPVSFDEKLVKASLGEETVRISIDLGDGDGHAVAWGCDLTYDYVKINASYRT